MRTWLFGAVAIIAAVWVLVVAFASAAAAQEQCSPKADMLAFLESQYGEVPVWSGVSVDGSPVALILTQNPDTGSWTVLGASAEAPDILCAGSVGIGGRVLVQGDPS